MSILTDSPSWFILCCLFAGLAYAGALYFKDKFNRNYGSRLATLLGVLRFVSVTTLAFFVLKPLIRTSERIVEKPVILIAQDNSQSLVVGKDSSYYRGEYAAALQQLIQSFGEEYEVRTLSFGGAVKEGTDSIDFSEKLTDMSELLGEIATRYSGRNLGAVIVASDGLYNKGQNPVYPSKKLNVPFYTIALGDTAIYRDLLIADVAVNRLAYLGNRFPVNLTIEARRADGLTTTLTVSRNGKPLYSEPILVSGEEDFRTIALSLDATEIGLQKYTVTLTAVSGEITLLNNRRDFFIDVLDGRQQVLILAHSPHPDIAAIREGLLTNESYNITTTLASEFKGNPADFSVVIFHQIPALNGVGNDLVNTFIDRNVPALFVWGAQSDYTQFNELGVGFSLDNARPNSLDAGGQVTKEFSLFTLSERVQSMFQFLPPLTLSFGDIRQSAGATSFVNQHIGRISTDKPLVAFNRYRDNRIGLIAGEGIWRWRLGAFQQYETHDAFNEWMTKTTQYLATREDKSLFRVNGAQDFPENMPVVFGAEVYNESYESVTDKEVRMIIRNENREEFSYSFSPSGQRYQLQAGMLPVGNYTYSASVVGNSSIPKETGEFSVSPLQLEASRTIADHRLMNLLATSNGGVMVMPQEMGRLPKLIRDSQSVTSTSYENKKLTDLINYRWLLALILLLLSLEWLLRKRAGTY